MRVRIVCYEDVKLWILGKIALRLCEHLKRLGIDSDIAKAPDLKADINHHIIFCNYNGEKSSVDTVMLTHFSNQETVEKIRKQLEVAEKGICMSSDTMQALIHEGIPKEKLAYVNPGHDGNIHPRKIILGITSKLFDDGRKREELVRSLFYWLPKDMFRFKIMGTGWEQHVKLAKEIGMEVEYHKKFDYKRYAQLIPSLDYYLYFGNDEGSMGILDALSAGVKTIVTPQGFHLDIPNGITHPFKDFNDLCAVFTQIIEDRHRLTSSVGSWTWAAYAQKHIDIWKGILK